MQPDDPEKNLKAGGMWSLHQKGLSIAFHSANPLSCLVMNKNMFKPKIRQSVQIGVYSLNDWEAGSFDK